MLVIVCMSAGVTAEIIMPGDVLWPNWFPVPGPEYMIHNTQSRKQPPEECCGCMATVIIISP